MMRLLPRRLSFVFPLCATLGNRGSRHLVRNQHDNPLIAPRGHGQARGLSHFGVNLTRIKLIAISLQQKVSD